MRKKQKEKGRREENEKGRKERKRQQRNKILNGKKKERNKQIKHKIIERGESREREGWLDRKRQEKELEKWSHEERERDIKGILRKKREEQ